MSPWFPYYFPIISPEFPHDFLIIPTSSISILFPFYFPIVSLFFPYYSMKEPRLNRSLKDFTQLQGQVLR